MKLFSLVALVLFAFAANAVAMSSAPTLEDLSKLNIRCNPDGSMYSVTHPDPRFPPFQSLVSIGGGENSLEAKYCRRLLVARYDEAFHANLDMPAADLFRNLDEIRSSAIRASEKIRRLEWQDILALNEESERVWQAMIACNEDADMARANYMKAGTSGDFTKICTRQDQSSDVSKQIKSLHGRVYDFVISTAAYMFKPESVEVPFHPLFVQVLEELFVLHNSYPILDEDNSKRYAEWRLLGQQMDFLLENRRSAGEVRSALYEMNGQLLKDAAADSEKALYFAKKTLNVVSLLVINSRKECGTWGLWPGVSRSVLGYTGYGKGFLFTKGVSEDEDVINDKIKEACGKTQNRLTVYDPNHRKANIYFVRQFRKLGLFYLGAHPDFANQSNAKEAYLSLHDAIQNGL